MNSVFRASLAILCLSYSSVCFSQPPNFNSADVIKAGAELYEKGDYKASIATYLKVPRNDTNYQAVLRDLALIYYADSNYKASREVALQGLNFYAAKADDWYNLAANAYEREGKQAEAIAYYDSIINRYQYAYLPWFNKGILYYDKSDLAQAKKCLQQAVLINPFYAPAHFQLGLIALDEGDLVSSILSFTTNLLVNPENKYAANSVTYLSNISKMTDNVVQNIAKSKAAIPDGFQMLQEIVSSKLALDPKYKLKAGLEDPIVRQLQVVIEKLSYDKSEQNFWMQYYVPFYQQLNTSGQFEPFINHIFSGLDIKEVAAYNKKNKKLVEAFVPVAGNYLDMIRETQQLDPLVRQSQELRFLFEDGELTGKGKTITQGGKYYLTGPWELYYTNGALRSKGTFNDKQEKTGLWTFYHENGKLKETTTYLADQPDGKTVSWYNNGQLAGEYMYKTGDLNGMVSQFYYNGLPKNVCNYKAGEKDGEEKSYNANGLLTSTANYKNGKEHGVRTYYHPNGNISSLYSFSDGKIEGPLKSYFLNGELNMEGTFVGDERSGGWKEYHNNGKVKATFNYVAGKLNGAYQEFYDNGAPEIRSNYTLGKLDGKYEDFDVDGKLYSSSLYEKGKLKELRFFDKANNVVSNPSISNGGGNLVYYDELGNKSSEGYFNKDGLREGKTTFFYPGGKVRFVATFKDGVMEGERIGYFKNGNVQSRINYSAGDENGYKTVYYINGNKAFEGMMADGQPDGTQKQYNELGQVTSTINYRDNEVEGFAEYFHPNGKPDYEQYFVAGWLQSIRQFDTAGNTLNYIDVSSGKAADKLKKLNGQPYVDAVYQHHYVHGQHKIFYHEKFPTVSNYRFGILDSTAQAYYYNGQLRYEGKYKMGERHGKWNFYFPSGALYYAETYDNGRLNGETKLYNDDGMLDKAITYVEGEIDGAYKMYGEDGALALLIRYQKGKITGYTYEGRDGKLLPDILVAAGKLKVEAYYSNGVKSADLAIEDGEINGMRNLYFKTGKPYVEGSRIWGQDNGLKKVYLPNGTLQKEQQYLNDNLHGLVKSYHTNSKLASEEYFYNGELHGACKYYDEAGKHIETRTYYYDILQAVNKH